VHVDVRPTSNFRDLVILINFTNLCRGGEQARAIPCAKGKPHPNQVHHDESKEKDLTLMREVLAPMIANGNVRVEGVFDVTWGGVSMLNAQLAMNEVRNANKSPP
jgi:hypothetical protein